MKKDSSKSRGGKKKMVIKGISLNGKLLENTEKAIEREDTDFSKYARNALREKNDKVLGRIEGE